MGYEAEPAPLLYLLKVGVNLTMSSYPSGHIHFKTNLLLSCISHLLHSQLVFQAIGVNWEECPLSSCSM